MNYEIGKWRVQWWIGSACWRITDITNAGKRGKTCEVFAVYDATKPKGDWLPDESTVQVSRFGQSYAVRVCHKNDAIGFNEESARRMHSYLTRCLSAPVRKLLAAFEVASSHSGTLCGESVHIPLGDNIDDPDQNIWLMPKETK